MANRREFLRGATVGLAGATLGGAACGAAATPPTSSAGTAAATPAGPPSWDEVRALFRLRPDLIHMASMLLASHPTPVREEIERFRRALDEDPDAALDVASSLGLDGASRRAAAAYCGGAPGDVALIDSTTMGLGLLAGGLRLAPGDEILTTEHDHMVMFEAVRVAVRRTGARVRRVRLYDDGATASVDQIVAAIVGGMRPETRVVMLTWVHSSTGVKLPIRAIVDALRPALRGYRPEHRPLICVDGVHGFGNEAERVEDLGCDFFVAGCHKWLFGPRGTGILWGRPAAWARLDHSIPPFGKAVSEAFVEGKPPPADLPPGELHTPGGFKAYEHRWAIAAAFALHQRIGPARIAARTEALTGQLKDGLATVRKLKVHTPRAAALSSGIVCVEVPGMDPYDVVEHLLARKIRTTASPYRIAFLRISPALVNRPEEIEATVRALRELAG